DPATVETFGHRERRDFVQGGRVNAKGHASDHSTPCLRYEEATDVPLDILGGAVADHALPREASEQLGDGRHVCEAGGSHLDRLFRSRLRGIRIFDDLPVNTALAHGCPLMHVRPPCRFGGRITKGRPPDGFERPPPFELRGAMSASAPPDEYQ